MSNVTFDTDGLDDIERLLEHAAARTVKERRNGLRRAARATFDAAQANAASYQKGTGALAAALTMSGTDLTQVIGANVREAWFLEVGSPNTGGPDPWLTDPAERSMTDLLKELGDMGEPW